MVLDVVGSSPIVRPKLKPQAHAWGFNLGLLERLEPEGHELPVAIHVFLLYACVERLAANEEKSGEPPAPCSGRLPHRKLITMKLYLSSRGIPNPKAFLKLSKSGPHHVVIIPTGWNTSPQSKSAPFIDEILHQFNEMHFSHELLNLEDFAGNGEGVRQELQSADAVWVLGGNSFYLNYWMHKSGFDTVLPGLLKKGLVYGGESAGAVVAGRTLHGIELLDNPDDAPDIIWAGLNLVDFGILTHWDHPKYADRIQQVYDEMQLFGPVKTLANDQTLVEQ